MDWSRVLAPWRRPPESFGLNGLDLKLAPYLKHVHRGFFVEAGANDGLNQSNTVVLERRGWKGLLVEPVPELAERCRRNRPACAVENCALVGPAHRERTVTMHYADLMSVMQGGMKTPEEEEAHVRKGCEIQNVRTYDVQVPAMTLGQVLDKYEVSHIDLLSLDIEGHEHVVLQGLDLPRQCPAWVLVEARYRADVEAFMAPHFVLEAQLSHHDLLFRARPRAESR